MENGSNQRYARFYSSDSSAQAAPILQIAYVNNTGLEGIWDYTSQSMGRAGTGHVNLYTGNLVWEHESMGFSGNRMPVTIKFYYNANDKGNNTFGAGYGWRTNYNQLVYQWSQDSTYYVWEDGDGTRHYFKYKSSGLYEDETDSKRTLTTTGSGGTVYCIKEEGSSIKSYFDSYGRLTQITNYQQTAHSITVGLGDGLEFHTSQTYSRSAIKDVKILTKKLKAACASRGHLNYPTSGSVK